MNDRQKLERDLAKIGRMLPRDMIEKSTTSSKPLAEQKDRIQNYIKRGNLSKEVKRRLAEMVDSGIYDRKVERLNTEQYYKNMDFIDKRIKEKIRKGELPDPRKVVQKDSFLRERWKRNA